MTLQPRTKVLWAKETELASGRCNQKARHPFYHLFACCSGDGVLCYGEKHVHLTSGECLLVHPEVLHETPKDTHTLLSFYEVKFEVYDPYLDDELRRCTPVFKMTPFLETALRYIVAHWFSKDEKVAANVDDMLSAMLVSIFSGNMQQDLSSVCIDLSRYHLNVKRIICYIEKNYDEHFRLDQMAEYFGLNPNYMCNIFKRQTNHTIIEYLNYLRIRHCINSFYYGKDQIIDVALDAGFASGTHFNRVFKKYTGTTPTTFRECFSTNVTSPMDSPAVSYLYEEKMELYIADSMNEAFETMLQFGRIAEDLRKQSREKQTRKG